MSPFTLKYAPVSIIHLTFSGFNKFFLSRKTISFFINCSDIFVSVFTDDSLLLKFILGINFLQRPYNSNQQ